MAKKISNRSGTPRYNAKADFPNSPAYRAPGSTGPAPINAGETSPGPQKGLMRVETVPGDPNFEHDILVRQGFYHPTKQKQVATHPSHRSRAMRGQPGSANDVLDQCTGLNDGALQIGLDSAE